MDSYVEQQYNDMLYRIYHATIESQRVRSISEDGYFSPVTKYGVPIRKLFVGNLAERTTYKDLQKLFSQYGEIESCFLRRNQGKSNYAFVTFNSADDAIKARIDGNKMVIRLHNRNLRVMPAYTWHQPEDIENFATVRKVCINTESTNDDDDTKIHMLNDDCLTHIFLYLPIVDRIRIERVCKRWRSLSQASWSRVKKLDLLKSTWGFSCQSSFNEIDTETVRKVLLRCGTYLKEIHFSHIFHNLDLNILSVVGKLCPNLQVINSSLIFISPCSIEALTTNCHDIRSLSLGKASHFCDSELTKLFKQSTKLRYFVACDMLRGDCLVHLPRNSIEEIILPDCDHLNLDNLSRALPKFENLLTLAIHKGNMHVTIDLPLKVMEALGTHCKQLRRLEIIGFKLVDSGCKMLIAELNNLEVLVLQETNINDEFLAELSVKCQKLTHIDISRCCPITNAGIAALGLLPKLEKLIINHIRGKEVATIVQHEKDFPSLKHLECRKCYLLSDSDICSLICSPLLEVVDLSGCCDISWESFEKVVEHTLTRKSKIVLKMFIGGTRIPYFRNISPFLQVINVNLSNVYDSKTVPFTY